MHFLKLHIDAHVKMSMCMYAVVYSSNPDMYFLTVEWNELVRQ